MPKKPSPRREWEKALIDSYHDYRWRQVLQPLHDSCQRWAAGGLTHADLDQAIHQTQAKTREMHRLFNESRDWLVRVIQFDGQWFQSWLNDHPAPPDVELILLSPVDESGD